MKARSRQNDPLDVQTRILDAAVEVLIERGYHGASTLEIQRRADVSRGGLLHHFPSRDTLLLAAAHHLERWRLSEAAGDLSSFPSDPAGRIDAAVDAISLAHLDGKFWASMELWVGARTHTGLASQVLSSEVTLGRLMKDTADTCFGPDIVARPLYPEFRDLMLTSLRGMAMTTSFDQRTEPFLRHVEKIKGVAHAMLLEPDHTPAPA